MRGPTEVAYYLSWESRPKESFIRASASVQRGGWASPIVDLVEIRVRCMGDGRRTLLGAVLAEHVGHEPDAELLDGFLAAFPPGHDLRIVADDVDAFLARGLARTLF